MNQGSRLRSATVALTLAMCGCGSMTAVTNSLDRLLHGDASNAVAPAELQEFEPSISVDRLWTSRIGKGADEHYLKLTPVVEDTTLFVADRYGRLMATTLESGEVIWEVRDKKLQYTGGPGAGAGIVLIGTGDARVIARESDTGKLRWVARVSSEVLAAPQAAGGVVVVRTADGKLYGLDDRTGVELWNYDRSVPLLTLRGTSAPTIDDDLVLAGFDNGRLVALELKTGSVTWESRLAIPSGRSDLERMVDVDAEPIIVGATVYVASFQGGIAAISVIDGQIEWTREISSYAEIAVDNNHVYITDADGSIWAVDRHSGASVWKQDGLANRLVSGPVQFNGHIVVGDFEGYVHWLDAATGNFSARVQVDDERILAPPISAGDVLLSYTSTGRLTAMRIQ